MHLAVCDDHLVDRKQMERLLGRESDRRIHTTGVLYIDSFGSQESILSTPMIYDAIFMDMTEDGCDAVELANALRARSCLSFFAVTRWITGNPRTFRITSFSWTSRSMWTSFPI